MSRSLRVLDAYINTAKLAVRRSGFPSQRALSEDVGLSLATVSNFLTGKPVDRATFIELCEKLSLDSDAIADLGPDASEALPQTPTPTVPEPSPPASPTAKRDWGEAMDVSVFYGRTEELATLERWIMADGCRLISLIGLGGMGKTALSITLAEQLQTEFDCVIWRSLRNAPPLRELLVDLLNFFSDQASAPLPDTLSGQIKQLVEYLRQSRCLCVLDNAESILGEGDRAGIYQIGYEAYGQFFQSVGESRHQSCLLITSREIPGGLSAKESLQSPIRSLQLTGLDAENAQTILTEKGLSSSEVRPLIERYSGNPLALKIASTTIQDLFDGDVGQFLDQGTVVYGDVSDLLEQQFNRLAQFEQQLMYWLAIAREPTTLSALREDILSIAAQKALVEALESLQQRSLIEKTAAPPLQKSSNSSKRKPATFTQQPVVMEYVTNRLIEQACLELCRDHIGVIDSHAFSKAQTKDYLRNTQRRLILKPLIEQLQLVLGSWEAAKACLEQNLLGLRANTRLSNGYAAGNLLNLLNELGVDLSGYDFSQLTVRQVYLQGIDLRRVDFTQADLTKSVFTQTLGDILSIDFSPDGTLLATGIDQQILLWQVANRRQIATLEGHTAWVRCVAFGPDGKLLASGSQDCTIRLWDGQTGQCLKTLRGHTSGIQTIAFSPDGKYLASGSHEPDVWLWDLETGDCSNRLQGHCDRILNVIFAHESQTLLSTSDDCSIRIWDIPSGDCRQTLAAHTNWLLSAALSPDGTTLVTGSEHQAVKFWNLETGECEHVLPDYQAEVWSVAFSPDGQIVATGSDDKTIRWWDVSTHQCLKTFQEHTHQVWLVKFSPNGQTFVSSGEDQTIKLWDVASGHCLMTIQSYSNWVAAIAFSPDDRTLASGSKDHQVRLWDIETGSCTRTLCGHSDVVTSVAFATAEGAQDADNLLASASDDHTIQLWQPSSGERLKMLQGHQGWVQSIALSPDAQQLVSGSSDHTIKLWHLRSGECLHTFAGHHQRVKTVAFAPQGHTIASGSDDQHIKLWDTQTGRCIQTLKGHTNWVLSIAYSPDGRYLISGSGDRTLKVWDLKTGKCLRTLEGHTHRVRSVAFSPDGLTLASGSEDCQVKLWAITSGECLCTLEGHQQIVWMVRFNHQGNQLASCSEDGTIRLWDSQTGHCLKVLRTERPYEGTIITGAKGLTSAQRSTLGALGAIGG